MIDHTFYNGKTLNPIIIMTDQKGNDHIVDSNPSEKLLTQWLEINKTSIHGRFEQVSLLVAGYKKESKRAW